MASTSHYLDSVPANADREQMILEHLPQVRWVAMRLHERLAGFATLDDLISIGVIGLINAIDNFDPSFNVKLKTYAEHKIRGAILDSVRGLDGVPTHKRKRIKEVQAAIDHVEQREQRTANEEEIAAQLGTDLATYQELLQEIQGVTVASLDAVVSNRDDSRTLLQFIAEPEDQSPARILERASLEKLVADGIRKMPKTESIILDLYYHQELGLQEIGTILGIHTTRVSQLKAQAVLRLRTYIQRHWPMTGSGTR